MEFWTAYRDKLIETKQVRSLQTPRPQYWFDVALGKSGVHLSNTFNTDTNEIGVRVYIGNKQVDEWLPYFESKKSTIGQLFLPKYLKKISKFMGTSWKNIILTF